MNAKSGAVQAVSNRNTMAQSRLFETALNADVEETDESPESAVEEIPEKPAPVEDDITHVAYVVNLSYGELNILNYAVQVL